MSFSFIIVALASMSTAISFIPQLLKLIKEKNAENVSLIMFKVLLIGLVTWTYYGIL